MRELKISQNSWVALALIGLVAILGFVGTQYTINLIQEIGVSSCTESVSGLTTVDQRIGLCQGGTAGQVYGKLDSGLIGWKDDATTAVTGAGADVLDLGDDDVNEATDFNELATTGDTNSIFTEPTADKLLIAVGNNWPTADVATALAANPTDCAANQFAISIVASGNLTCGAIVDADVPNTITVDNSTTATALAANGANCGAGNYPLGVDASGAVESCTAVAAGGSAIIFDIGDDAGNDSIDVNEIATTGDTNTIFTEPSADKILITLTNNWPSADTADALDSNPTDCSANQYANAIAANGNLTCGAISDADVPNSITITLAATATALAADPADCGANAFAISIVASGALTCATLVDADIPDSITVTLAATATALAANGGNCAAGSAPLGVDASGAVESCTDYEEDLADSAGLAAALSDETGTGLAVFDTSPTFGGTVAVTGAGSSFALNLDCTGNANGGALTTNGLGILACSDDDGGAGGSAFETITPTAGTSPVASGSDTLVLVSTDGTVAITGTAGTDTLDFGVTSDSITTDYLSDGADAPVAGECLLVASGGANVEYATCPGGGSGDITSVGTCLTGDCFTAANEGATLYLTGSSPSHQEGAFFYDVGEHAFGAYSDEADITLQIGQENWVRVFNNSGATIVNGKPVYISGANSVENRPTIALARADALTTSELIGVTTHDIENNSFGYVTAFGLVNGLDLSAFAVGDILYVDETVAGDYRTTPPPDTNFAVRVGYVIFNDVSGRLLVNMNADLGIPAGDAKEVVIEVLKASAGTISVGEVVHLAGYNVGLGLAQVELADADDAALMPAHGIARDTITNSTSGFVVVVGRETGLDTSSFTAGDQLFVGTTAGALVNTAPTGATTEIQKVAEVIRSNASNGVIVIGSGRTNAVPNIADDSFWLGSSTGVATATAIPDCNTNNQDRLQYDTATNAVSCDTDGFTTTEISGLDISDDTNLTCLRSLTISGDGCNADAELYSWEKTIVITTPLTGSLTNLAQFPLSVAVTVTRVACSTSSGTLTIQMDERAEVTPNSAGTNIMTSNLACDTNSEITTSFTNAGIAQYAPVNVQIISGTGSPEAVRIHLFGTRDD